MAYTQRVAEADPWLSQAAAPWVARAMLQRLGSTVLDTARGAMQHHAPPPPHTNNGPGQPAPQSLGNVPLAPATGDGDLCAACNHYVRTEDRVVIVDDNGKVFHLEHLACTQCGMDLRCRVSSPMTFDHEGCGCVRYGTARLRMHLWSSITMESVSGSAANTTDYLCDYCFGVLQRIPKKA